MLLGRRVIALAIDWFACLLLARLIFPEFEYGSNSSALATMLIFFVEVVILTTLTNASFGQRIAGIGVFTPEGGRAVAQPWGTLRIVARTALICVVIPVVIMDSEGRGLHDKVGGTKVFKLQGRTLMAGPETSTKQ